MDAGDLEDELMPSLRRNSGLIARALGRSRLPDWLHPACRTGCRNGGPMALCRSTI
ncbi:hypothetical protein SBA3_1980036 [Candidatus Sulfopaludibacter sp. SbA3]|nr:hypothetical protein SBA3_1980036 [Candidatus Sulfopaludibacter sp. SbA3]